MKKKSKHKTNIFIRVIAAVIIIAVAGVASYFGSKAIFTYKFTKDKEEAEEKEQEEAANTIQDNYITVVRVGNLTTLRIFNTKQSTLSFIVMRPDSDLFTYDEDGEGESIEKVVNNIQNAYGITVNSYEDFDQEAFANFINNNDSFECDLPNAVSFKDTNKMTVNIDAGEQHLNGGYLWGVVSGEGEYESQEAYMENVKAVVEGMMAMIFEDPTEDSITSIAETIYDNCESDVSIDDIENYIPLYAELSSDDITVTEFEGEETDDGFEVDIDKAKELISDLTDTSDESSDSEETTTTEETTTEEATTEAESISSEGKTIYIRNAAGISGLAASWKTELSDDGFTIGSVDNYSETYDQTVINVSEEGMGQDLKEKYFEDAEIKVGDVEDGADICIYLGKDADTL